MTTAQPLSSRLYLRLLAFYPEELRRDYAAEMALVFADDLASARSEAGARGALRVWRCAAGEFFRLALPTCIATPAVRVPAITIAIFAALISAMLPFGLDPAPQARVHFLMLHAALLLPLFSTPFLALLSFWACRGSRVVSVVSGRAN